MPDSRDIDWYRPVSGDVFGGFGREFTARVRVRATVRTAAVQSVIGGPFCVEAGAIFSPGMDAGQSASDKAGQVNC